MSSWSFPARRKSQEDILEELDSVLIRLAADPDEEPSWQRFFALTWPYVLALCHRSLPGSRRVLDAEDVAQEVLSEFVRYWRASGNIRRPITAAELRALLAVITRHAAADAARWLHRVRRDSRRQTSLRDDLVSGSRSSTYAALETEDLLNHVMQSMDSTEREVFGLRLQGYNAEEIAKTLDMPLRTVERRLASAREVFRKYSTANDLGGL